MLKSAREWLVPPPAPLQFVMFGLSGSGKTHLLYGLKFPEWKSDMDRSLKAMAPPPKPTKCPHCSKVKQPEEAVCPHCDSLEEARDPGYHYEEFRSNQFVTKYAIWDVPGSEAMMSIWPMFYRYIQVQAVFFVVDASAEGATSESLAKARSKIHYLFHEDELQASAFILLLNTRGDKVIDKDAIDAKLDIALLKKRQWDIIRFKELEVDVAKLKHNDGEWKKILQHINKVMVCRVDY